MSRFSILTPVCDPPAEVLAETVASVLAQRDPDWEWCVVDDCSEHAHVRALLQDAADTDPRIRLRFRTERGGIVAASNDALAMASGDFVALLDHDDLLHPDALAAAAAALDDDPAADYVYTDEDKVDAGGRHYQPFLKPDWSPERFRTQMYTCHLSVLRRSLVESVGGFRPEYEGSQDWDLVLRVTEQARSVLHVPEVLYSWRALSTSAAASGPDAKAYAYDAGTRALQAHCDRIGLAATVSHDEERSGVYHLHPRLAIEPPVSIVIPTAGTRRDVRLQPTTLVSHCVTSILERSTYQAYEVVVVLDDHAPPALGDELVALDADRVRLVDFDRPFNFSEKVNVGALHASGEHLLILNDDMEVLTPDWIERLVMYSQHEPVGAIGARLWFGDGTLQHAGVAFRGGLPGHICRGFPPEHAGYFNHLLLAGNHLAVTGACLMTRRRLFEQLGGLSTALPLSFNDVDYCLKVWQSGHRVVYDPDVELIHFESASRDPEVATWELDLLQSRWGHLIDDDPFLPRLMAKRSVDYVPPVSFADGSILA